MRRRLRMRAGAGAPARARDRRRARGAVSSAGMPDFGDDRAGFLERLNQAMIAAVPYNAALGLEVVDFGAGTATIRLPYKPELVGNPENGVLHGGVVTGLIDATCGLAVFMKLPEPTRIATLDLRIDYLKPATPGEPLHARAECYKLSKQVAFVRASAFHGEPDDAIASAAGTFMIFDEGTSPVAEQLKKTP